MWVGCWTRTTAVRLVGSGGPVCCVGSADGVSAGEDAEACGRTLRRASGLRLLGLAVHPEAGADSLGPQGQCQASVGRGWTTHKLRAGPCCHRPQLLVHATCCCIVRGLHTENTLLASSLEPHSTRRNPVTHAVVTGHTQHARWGPSVDWRPTVSFAQQHCSLASPLASIEQCKCRNAVPWAHLALSGLQNWASRTAGEARHRASAATRESRRCQCSATAPGRDSSGCSHCQLQQREQPRPVLVPASRWAPQVVLSVSPCFTHAQSTSLRDCPQGLADTDSSGAVLNLARLPCRGHSSAGTASPKAPAQAGTVSVPTAAADQARAPTL